MPKPLISSQATFQVNKRFVMTAAAMINEGVVDQIINATPIVQWSMGVDQMAVGGKTIRLTDLKPSRQLKFVRGGISYDFRARVGKNSSFKAITGYDTVDITAQEGFTKLSETPRLYAGSVVVDYESELQNMGDEAKEVDLLDMTTEQAFADARDTIQLHMWQTAAQAGTKELVGIPQWVAADPRTGTIATANRANATWFRNQYNGTGGFITDTTPSFGTDGLSYMLQAIIACSGGQGADEPTDIWNATDVFRYYFLRLQPQEQYVGNAALDGGAKPLMWDGKRMWYDGGIASGAQYYLNRNYWHFAVHPQAFFSMTTFIQNIEALAKVAKLVFYGTPVCILPIRQGTIQGWTS